MSLRLIPIGILRNLLLVLLYFSIPAYKAHFNILSPVGCALSFSCSVKEEFYIAYMQKNKDQKKFFYIKQIVPKFLLYHINKFHLNIELNIELNSRLSWCRVTNVEFKRDMLWVRFPLEEIKYLIFSASRQSVAMSSTAHQTRSPEFGGNQGTECLNTSFPLFTLLCTRYSMKLKQREDSIIIQIDKCI